MNTDFVVGQEDITRFSKQWHEQGYVVTEKLSLDVSMSPRDRALKIYVDKHADANSSDDEDLMEGPAHQKGLEDLDSAMDSRSGGDLVDVITARAESILNSDDSTLTIEEVNDRHATAADGAEVDEELLEGVQGPKRFRRQKQRMLLKDVRPFVEKIANEGPTNAWTIIISTDPHWYNRVLIELNLSFGLSDERTSITFFDLLLSLARLAFPSSCLPYQEELGLKLPSGIINAPAHPGCVFAPECPIIHVFYPTIRALLV